jgi:hypothetical protein
MVAEKEARVEMMQRLDEEAFNNLFGESAKDEAKVSGSSANKNNHDGCPGRRESRTETFCAESFTNNAFNSYHTPSLLDGINEWQAVSE